MRQMRIMDVLVKMGDCAKYSSLTWKYIECGQNSICLHSSACKITWKASLSGTRMKRLCQSSLCGLNPQVLAGSCIGQSGSNFWQMILCSQHVATRSLLFLWLVGTWVSQWWRQLVVVPHSLCGSLIVHTSGGMCSTGESGIVYS